MKKPLPDSSGLIQGTRGTGFAGPLGASPSSRGKARSASGGYPITLLLANTRR